MLNTSYHGLNALLSRTGLAINHWSIVKKIFPIYTIDRKK
ncbi:hypothetical protein FDUTEX481_08739 [Tolypothrix sp. PCC 7601]|nr:hypothetical protein FDUTEX481_08739 [Tolypothrix sp. PCC 7601]